MEREQHLDLLSQGAEIWNTWRAEHPEISPQLAIANLVRANLTNYDLRKASLMSTHLNYANLTGAKLAGACLIGADLSYAKLNNASMNDTDLGSSILIEAELRNTNLTNANLIRARLTGANLTKAILRRAALMQANLNDTDLTEADLSGTSLSMATLVGANLSNTNLSNAMLYNVNLSNANLKKTNLKNTNFHGIEIGSTVFEGIDFRTVSWLETVIHTSPSSIGTDTILRSSGNIPKIFLQKAGVSENLINYAQYLINNPVEYYTCFISYSSQDQEFAEQLYADLTNKRIWCWFALEDLKIGDKIRPSIDKSIRERDKMLLVLSQHSIASQWVEQEVERALARERKEKKAILFPIRLDNTVMDIEEGWPAFIHNTRNIGNFTLWKEHDTYLKSLQRLIHDLKAEPN